MLQHGLAGAVSGTAECTFAPAIDPGSARLLEDATNLPRGFQARQAAWAAERRARLQRRAAEQVGPHPVVPAVCCTPAAVPLFRGRD